MSFWKDETKFTGDKSENSGWRLEQEEVSEELIQDHIFKCYDRDKR